MIELRNVAYDIRARDGTWCRLPYPGHKKGCPNFPKCPARFNDFKDLEGRYSKWSAVIEEFNLKSHAEGMRLLHPQWTERQCRNLLYWQKGIMKSLLFKAYGIANCLKGDIILRIPEACGINVFETMERVGIVIDRHPEIVRKVMLVGER